MTQPKTVKAWAFARNYGASRPFLMTFSVRRLALIGRSQIAKNGARVGPVVRIEVPAPKARSAE